MLLVAVPSVNKLQQLHVSVLQLAHLALRAQLHQHLQQQLQPRLQPQQLKEHKHVNSTSRKAP